MKSEPMPKRKLHPIGYVARTLGLSPHVLRAWEKRYEAVQPGRSSKNRRLYSQEDISYLALLKAATDKGQSISSAVKLDVHMLGRVAARRPSGLSDGTPENIKSVCAAEAASYVELGMDAVRRMDESRLENALQDSLVGLTRLQVMSSVVSPLMQKIGNEWAAGSLKIAKEHLASRVVEGFLWDMLRNVSRNEWAPSIVVATPAGQWCEFGAMMSAICAADCGWKPVYLGPNVPAEEIAAAVELKGADAVALSITCQTENGMLYREVSRLRDSMGEEIRIFIGGRAASTYRRAMDDAKAVGFESLTDFCDFLTRTELSPEFPKRR
jgi:methanogenic corrinoid protein MtbC1